METTVATRATKRERMLAEKRGAQTQKSQESMSSLQRAVVAEGLNNPPTALQPAELAAIAEGFNNPSSAWHHAPEEQIDFLPRGEALEHDEEFSDL